MNALRIPTYQESSIVAAIVSAIDALSEQKLAQLGAWSRLAELSALTEFDAIGANEASVVLNGNRFEAIADIYVLLNYGSGKDGASLSDSYVATIRGSIINGDVSITEVDIDTSPFYL